MQAARYNITRIFSCEGLALSTQSAPPPSGITSQLYALARIPLTCVRFCVTGVRVRFGPLPKLTRREAAPRAHTSETTFGDTIRRRAAHQINPICIYTRRLAAALLLNGERKITTRIWHVADAFMIWNKKQKHIIYGMPAASFAPFRKQLRLMCK